MSDAAEPEQREALNPALDEAAPAGARSPGDGGSSNVKKVKAHQLLLLRDLKASLDILYVIQVAVVYYRDNSFVVLVLRLCSQSLLTHEEAQPTIDPVHTYFAAVFVPGILCFCIHVILSIAAPGEATRGYLHGGLLLDFVGQSGPTSRLQLILHDLIIFCIQLVYLDVTRRQDTIKSTLGRPRQVRRPPTLEQWPGRAPDMQDMDMEERAIEQQSGSQSEEPFNLQRTNDIDTLYSGQADLGAFYLLNIVKDKHLLSRADLSGPTLTLRSVIGADIRRRGYSLNIPFRS